MVILRESVSAKPLFDWFRQHKHHRAQLRAAGYSDGCITNWKSRGIPRAEVGNIAQFMGLTYEQYVEVANLGKEWRQVAATAFCAVLLLFSATDSGATLHNQNSESLFAAKYLSKYTFSAILKLLQCFAKLFRSGQSFVVEALQGLTRTDAARWSRYHGACSVHP